MPLSIYIAWLIFAFGITFYSGRTYIELNTNRKEFFDTCVTLWHGRNELWHPEPAASPRPYGRSTSKASTGSCLQHIARGTRLPVGQHQDPRTPTSSSAGTQMEGTICGIKNIALFG